MFATPFTSSMLQYQSQHDIFNQIITAMNGPSIRGMIFGSAVHRMLSQLSYTPGDLDILFASHDQMDDFLSQIRGIFPQFSSTNRTCYSTHHTYAYAYTYTYTSHLAYGGMRDAFTMRIQPEGSVPFNHGITIHGNVLNMTSGFTEEECACIDMRDASTAALLATKLCHHDFLANFYINGMIYHKLENVTDVTISTLLTSKGMDKIVRKYVRRGVKISLIDVSQAIAPTKEALTIAKDDYRSKGLTVIPLSRRDRETAGKCPNVSNWTSLSNVYNFTVNEHTDNIGILCGPSSGIVCIDVDRKDRGVELFDKMVALYGPLPAGTAVQRTPNNGYHYIFKYDPKRMRGMMTKIKCPKLNTGWIGIDMWIQRCQFVASPSINYTNGKTYEWINPITTVDALPDLPEWIYELYYGEQINEQGIILEAQSCMTAIEPIEVALAPTPAPVQPMMSYGHSEYIIGLLIMILTIIATHIYHEKMQ
jgi:hypothetical protein